MRNKLLKVVLLSENDKERRYSLKGIGNKIEIISAILKWAGEISYTPEDRYLKVWKSQIEGLDTLALQNTLKESN